MADTVSTQCSQDDGEPGSALATAAPVVQATPGGSQALETQTSSKPPPKMSLEVPVVCITPPSPIPGDSQDKPAESSPEKPNRVDGDPLQYLSCEVPNVSTKHPAAAAKESSLGVVPDINLDPLKHKQESTVLGGSEESRKEHEEQINVQIKSPLDNCPANHPLTDAERSVEKSDTRVEISTEKAASFESVSDSVTTCNESSTEKLTSESETSLKTSDEVGNATLENIPDSASLTEKNNTDHGAELSEDNTKNISPSSKDQTTPLTSSSSSVTEENVKEVVSSSSQEQVQAPVSENRASKVPLVLTDRSSSLPTVFSDQQSSKVPSAANQSSGSPLSCPSALADTLQSASSKEESNSSAVSDCSVSKNAHSSRTVQNSSSECGVEVEQSEVSSERSKEKTTDSISVTENLKEPLESEDVAKASKLTIKKVDEINDDHEVNTVDTTKVLSEQNVAHEVPVETIPVIVNTEEREQVKIGREVQGNFVSPVIPSSHSSAIASPDNVSSVDAEQLQPVTIGSSLQPLEEVQEASVSGDPSFAAADLALIDSSADEADSIGGLVINSVIGAADGVADFHPDEMETDRELTDISASAPHTVGENCDNVDSSDEIEPSAKRMRFENGGDDIEDKLQTSRSVNIKVSPIKNGHGLWDACKLRQILLEKGTIMMRLHASVDHMEMNDSDKENKDVDFTGIMIEIKDDDQDHILGLASLEPDADLCDPLAIGLTHNLDHTSPPHYSRGYPHHPRGRSTTLQPAMTRPVFKHLQSPPHSQHYMKQDLLGHPQPLEFEEPQLGTTEWAGKEYYGGLLLQRKAFPPSQYPGMSPAPPPPPRGRKRGRPPLSSRRGHCPPGGFPRSSPSKSRAYGKRHPEPIKYRPPTPPHHLLVSTLLKLNKSHYMANKAESKKVMKHLENLKHDILPGDGKKLSSTGKGSDDEDEICLSVSQPHPTKTEEESVDTDTGLKRGLIKLSCEFCDLVFRKRSALTAHIKHKHRGMQICPICSDKIKVKGKYGMRFHILKSHKDHPHFSCKKCGESFKLQHHLMNHERLKHELMDSEDEDHPQVNGDQSKNDKAFREMEEEEKRKDMEKNEREKLEREKLERDKEKAKAEREKKLREDQEGKRKEKESDSRVDKEDGAKSKGRPRSEVNVGIASKVPPRSISRGKIMNVRPPTKEVTKSKGGSPKPERRVTRSKGPIKVRDAKSESDSDDDDDDNETAVGAGESSSSSTSSSDSEVEESKKYFCDICELGFSHKFKLKHHQKEKHSRATRSQASAKGQDNMEQEDGEEEEEQPEENSREENERGDDDEEEDEDEEDDEEEEIRKEKERKEKERKEKEESLKCNLCNKQCRSEYQLRLHMPVHNVVKKGQSNKKSAAPVKVYGKAKEQENLEDQLETSAGAQVKQIRDTSRVLRSSPHGTVRGVNTESSKESGEKGKEQSPKRKSDSQKKDACDKTEESLREQRESNERPSYLLKVGSLFRCTKCNITFNREKSMTYHLKKIHETLYPFRACEHCGKIFRSCGPYNRHVIQHRVHHCPEANCKAKYRKMLRLKQHQKNAHPNKPFRCSKCVAIFCKESELEKHQDAKHPRIPSDEEEGSSEEEEEEEDADEEEYEKKKDDDPVSKDHVKKREKDKDDDDNEELSTPTKRRARCVPISYKEPDDEEDVIPVRKGQPFKNVVVKPTTPEKKEIQNKAIPDRRGSIDKRSKLLKRSCADSESVEEAKPSVPCENDRKTKPTSNNSSEKSVSQEDKKIAKGQEPKIDKRIPPQTKVLPAKEVVSKLDSPPTQKVKSGKKTQQKQVVPGNKKNKVNLSWTAALKAQIRAAKSGSKGTSKKKKNNSSEKGCPRVRRRPSSSSGGQLTTQNMDFPYGHSQSQDSLSCQGYFVGEDSMFSLDDSSQMDIMGDYYGAHYPPSEEISDFVPEDDESGPAKIIGFDSF